MTDFDFIYYSNYKYITLLNYYMELNGLSYIGVFFTVDKENMNEMSLLNPLELNSNEQIKKEENLLVSNSLLYDLDLYSSDLDFDKIKLTYKSINSFLNSHKLTSHLNYSYVSNLLGINKTITPFTIKKENLDKKSSIFFAWVTFDIISNTIKIHNKFLDIFTMKSCTFNKDYIDLKILQEFYGQIKKQALFQAEHYSYTVKFHTDMDENNIIRWI